jgi:hypothetical protein
MMMVRGAFAVAFRVGSQEDGVRGLFHRMGDTLLVGDHPPRRGGHGPLGAIGAVGAIVIVRRHQTIGGMLGDSSI